MSHPNKHNINNNLEDDTATAPARPKLKRPPRYNVLLMNDDYTPMEFVVEVLETYFRMSAEKAHQIMLRIHNRGSAICGTYSRDIAETKTAQVNSHAQKNDHPLLCIAEPE